MKKFNTYLPVFTGFYNTIFEADESSEIDIINEERSVKGFKELDYNSFEFDYKSHEENTIFYCIDYVQTQLNDLGIKNTIKSEGLQSPKFYNFSNDSINIEIEINFDAVLNYINSNIEAFAEYIKNRYTSCPGFISSYSNNYLDWLEFEIIENSAHCIGSVLNFIIFNEISEPEINMYYNIQDNHLFCINYDELINNE